MVLCAWVMIMLPGCWRIFTRSSLLPPTHVIWRMLSNTQGRCRELVGEFARVEVDLALSQMALLKASGPDGMPPIFYQHYWQSIGGEVTDAVLDCLKTRKIPPGLNHTLLILIPKVKRPEKVSNF